jgi:hypothetical protein
VLHGLQAKQLASFQQGSPPKESIIGFAVEMFRPFYLMVVSVAACRAALGYGGAGLQWLNAEEYVTLCGNSICIQNFVEGTQVGSANPRRPMHLVLSKGTRWGTALCQSFGAE